MGQNYNISNGGCVIAKGVTTIGDSEFANFELIKKIKLPSTLKSIGKSAFHSCTQLTSVFIPSSVTEIGIGAFNDCSRIDEIVVDFNNLKYMSDGNCCLSKNGETLIFGCKSSIIPNFVKHIGDSAFEAMELENIHLPQSIVSIGERAFAVSPHLMSIILPANLGRIGKQAFYCCDELEELTIPGTVKCIEDEAFWGCKKLSSVTIQNGVKEIKESAFYNCPKLTSIKIPSSVQKFGWRAFEKRFLKDIYLSDSPSKYNALVNFFQSGLFGGYSKERVQIFRQPEPLKDKINITLHVPQGTKQDYKNHPFFGKFDF